MADNPLAGLSIPALRDIADRVVYRLGIGTLDLANNLQRERLKRFIESALSVALNSELEHALQAATNKALTHVFRVMRDADYQEKRRKRREIAAKTRLVRKQAKDEADREARMDYSKRRLEKLGPGKTTVQ